MSSAVWGARRALYELLVESDDPVLVDGVQKTFGPPVLAEEQKMLGVAGVRNPEEAEAGLGGNRKKEEFTVEVLAMVWAPGASSPSDAMEVERQIGEILDAVRRLVHGNRTLKGALDGNVASVVGTESPGPQPAAKSGIVQYATLLVRCRATVSDDG